MAAIRIQLGNLPPLVGEMLVALLGGPGAAEIVGHSGAEEDPLQAAQRSAANLLVMAQPAADDPLAALFTLDSLSVLTLPAGSERGRLVDLAGSELRLDRGMLSRLARRLAGPARDAV